MAGQRGTSNTFGGTAGVGDFDYVRKFYADNGFETEVRIRDFYEASVDKVVFRKSLAEIIGQQKNVPER